MFEHTPVSHLPSNRPLTFWVGEDSARKLKHLTLEAAVRRLTLDFSLDVPYYIDHPEVEDYPYHWGLGFMGGL